MTTKNKVILSGVVILVSFAAGRFSVPTKIEKTEDKTSEVDKNKHKETTIVVVTKPDGTKQETTEIVEDTSIQNKKTDDKSLVEIHYNGKTNISALAGTNFGTSIAYGVHASTALIGPISVGAFGFTSGIVGVSVGLQF